MTAFSRIEAGKSDHEHKKSMLRGSFEEHLDLCQADIDPEVFAVALAMRHIRSLIAYGGSEFGRPDDKDAFHPDHLEGFLARTCDRLVHGDSPRQ